MGKCLVTKLQGVVDDINLPLLGYMNVHITNKDTIRGFRFIPRNKSLISYIVNGKNFVDTDTNEHAGDILLENLPSGELALQLPKYDVGVVDFYGGPRGNNEFTFNIEDLKYGTNITRILLQQSTGITGNLHELVGCCAIDSTDVGLNVFNTSVGGTLIDALNLFAESNYESNKIIKILAGDSNVTGNVKDFIDLWASRAQEGALLFLNFEHLDVDYSELTPTEGVPRPKNVSATCTGNGTYTHEFSV